MKILHTLQLFPRAKHQYFQELIPFNWTKEIFVLCLKRSNIFHSRKRSGLGARPPSPKGTLRLMTGSSWSWPTCPAGAGGGTPSAASAPGVASGQGKQQNT